MKVLVFCVVSCLVVLSHGGKYDGPKHVPVIDENGVPVETPEVREAREQHLKALLRAEKLNGGNTEEGNDYEQEQETRYVAPKYLPEPPKKGVYLENYELKVPKNEDRWNDNRYNGEDRWNEPNQWNDNNQNEPRPNEGVSYNQNTLRYGDGGNQGGPRYGIVSSKSYNKYEGPTHVPILTKDGVPEETPEVKAAREEHLRALEKARLTTGTLDNEDTENPENEDNGVEYRENNTPRQVVTVAKPLVTLEKPIVTEVRPILSTSEYAKENPGLIPKIGKNGVPLDTPEVYQAKLRHFAALARAAQLATGQYNPKNQIEEDDGSYQEVRYKPNVGYDLENRYRENEGYRPEPYRINRPNIVDPYRIDRPNIVDPYRIDRPIVDPYRINRPNPEPYRPNVYKVNSYKSYVPIPQNVYRPDSFYKPTIPPYIYDGYRPKGYPVLVKVHNPPSPYPIAYNNIENSNRLVRYVVVHDQKPRRY